MVDRNAAIFEKELFQVESDRYYCRPNTDALYE